MNADAFRHFYEYHFSENRKLWELVATLLHEQFTQPVCRQSRHRPSRPNFAVTARHGSRDHVSRLHLLRLRPFVNKRQKESK
jgi:hypothetical protein